MDKKERIKVLLLALLFCYFCPIMVGAEEENTKKTTEQEKSVSQLIQELKSDKAQQRASAAEELGNRKDNQAVPFLIAALKDKELTVKSESCVALGKIKDANAVPALVERLKDKKENWSIQVYSAQALSDIGDNSAFEPLLEALKDECERKREKLDPPIQRSVGSEDEAIESKMAQSLFKLEVSSKNINIPKLFEKLKSEKRMSKFRYYLATILGKLGDKEVVPVLIEYLSGSENGLFRERCARILGDLGDKTAIEPLKKALNDDFICISTGDVEKNYGYTVRLAAYCSLKKLGVNVEKKGDEYRVIE